MAAVRFVTPVRTCLVPESLVEDLVASLNGMPWESGGRSAALVFTHGLALARGNRFDESRGRADTLTPQERLCILRAIELIGDRHEADSGLRCLRQAVRDDFPVR
jgi:hypothetical protein